MSQPFLIKLVVLSKLVIFDQNWSLLIEIDHLKKKIISEARKRLKKNFKIEFQVNHKNYFKNIIKLFRPKIMVAWSKTGSVFSEKFGGTRQEFEIEHHGGHSLLLL